jgi:hypothetical protein
MQYCLSYSLSVVGEPKIDKKHQPRWLQPCGVIDKSKPVVNKYNVFSCTQIYKAFAFCPYNMVKDRIYPQSKWDANGISFSLACSVLSHAPYSYIFIT